MSNKNSFSKYQQLALRIIKQIPNPRTGEIISLRFGLEDGQRRTLEAVGQKYGITRERVRQVEKAAFFEFGKPEVKKLFQPAFKTIDIFLNQEGQLVREERLLSLLANTESSDPSRGVLYFILTLGQHYNRFVNYDKFFPVWTNSEDVFNKASQTIDSLLNRLIKEGQPVSEKQLTEFLKELNHNISKRALLSYIDATKQINQNNLGQFGLTSWPEINPRGVKDKAYIIFKGKNKPLHFSEVANLINSESGDSYNVQVQTVHNELIKDDRFVLVGRGIYALKEWGYQPGTVRQVIANLLKESGPLSKNEILYGVLKDRLVKENTVLINLQNRNHFIKEADGKYKLAK